MPITFIGPRKSGPNCPHKMATFGSVEPLIQEITGHAGTSDTMVLLELTLKMISLVTDFPGHLNTEGKSN